MSRFYVAGDRSERRQSRPQSAEPSNSGIDVDFCANSLDVVRRSR